jgi:hypothetical protein
MNDSEKHKLRPTTEINEEAVDSIMLYKKIKK